MVTGGTDVKWWSSSKVVENFLLGLGMRSLGSIGCKESVDFVVW